MGLKQALRLILITEKWKFYWNLIVIYGKMNLSQLTLFLHARYEMPMASFFNMFIIITHTIYISLFLFLHLCWFVCFLTLIWCILFFMFHGCYLSTTSLLLSTSVHHCIFARFHLKNSNFHLFNLSRFFIVYVVFYLLTCNFSVCRLLYSNIFYFVKRNQAMLPQTCQQIWVLVYPTVNQWVQIFFLPFQKTINQGHESLYSFIVKDLTRFYLGLICWVRTWRGENENAREVSNSIMDLESIYMALGSFSLNF